MEQMAARLPFWSLLTEREQETVRRSAVTRRYEKGALIHDGGSECLGMLLVLSGEIRTYLLSDEGREVTLYRLYPDDLCVLSASCVISQITFDTQICAQRETEVLIIPASIVAALREQNLPVRCFLYELATQRFSDVMWAMQQILFKSLDRRLATFLLAEAERTAQHEAERENRDVPKQYRGEYFPADPDAFPRRANIALRTAQKGAEHRHEFKAQPQHQGRAHRSGNIARRAAAAVCAPQEKRRRKHRAAEDGY